MRKLANPLHEMTVQLEFTYLTQVKKRCRLNQELINE